MAELKRTLSFPVVLIMAVMACLGMNIYVLVQIGAWAAGGVGAFVSLGILIFLSILFSLIFAELVGMFPQSGGVYEYAKQALGPFWAFMFGWVTLLNLTLGISVVFVDAISHLNPEISTFALLASSIVFVLLFNWFAYFGMQASSRLIVFIGLVTLATIVIFVIAGFPYFSWENLWTAAPESAPIGPFTLLVAIGVFYMAEIFFGWENATFLAGEAKDPERNMPRVMWGSTLIVAVLVLVFTVIAIGAVTAGPFGDSYEPFLLLADSFFPAWGPVVAFVIFLSSLGAIATWVVGASRLVMSLAEDKLMPHSLAQVHPKHGTPYKAIVFQTVASVIFLIVAEANTDTLYDFILPLDIIMYLVVLFTFLRLRKTMPDHLRPFRVRFGVPIALFLIAALIATVVGWAIPMAPGSTDALLFDGKLILIGIPIYLLLLFTYSPDAIIRFTETFAYASLWLENWLLPKRVRHEILTIFKELEHKRVLEYGAGVGTLTMHIAERVGPHGHVTATDISAKSLAILDRRMRKRNFLHVKTIHDPHQVNRIHPDVKEVDIVFSVGMLSYIQDMQKVLRDVHRVLPERGKVCFVEYVDYFRVLPNAKWLDSEETLKQLFREAGFSVQVVRVRGLFWNYLFIYGEKTRHAKAVPFI